ncbi:MULTISPECIES: DUF6966 domain-containing protein [unclassified Bradyrhizobium]
METSPEVARADILMVYGVTGSFNDVILYREG